jgi:hypothetical protein
MEAYKDIDKTRKGILPAVANKNPSGIPCSLFSFLEAGL